MLKHERNGTNCSNVNNIHQTGHSSKLNSIRPPETRLSWSLCQTQHKSNSLYRFQASPILLGGALLTLTFKMRFLCFRLSLLAKKRANKPLCFYKIKRKQKRCFIFSHEGEMSHLPALPFPRSLPVICSLVSGPFPSSCTGQGREAIYSLKGCLFKRHLTYITTQRNNSSKRSGTLVFHRQNIHL